MHPVLLTNIYVSLVTLSALFVCLCAVLASSGIDYDVKIWAPLEAEPCFDVEAAQEVGYSSDFCLPDIISFILSKILRQNQVTADTSGEKDFCL